MPVFKFIPDYDTEQADSGAGEIHGYHVSLIFKVEAQNQDIQNLKRAIEQADKIS